MENIIIDFLSSIYFCVNSTSGVNVAASLSSIESSVKNFRSLIYFFLAKMKIPAVCKVYAILWWGVSKSAKFATSNVQEWFGVSWNPEFIPPDADLAGEAGSACALLFRICASLEVAVLKIGKWLHTEALTAANFEY